MTNDVNIRGPISLDQLKQETKRVTFGIELECIAVYPLELFEDDDRNARGDAIAALSLACMDRGIKSSGREDIDDEEEWHLNSEPSYSMFCFGACSVMCYRTATICHTASASSNGVSAFCKSSSPRPPH